MSDFLFSIFDTTGFPARWHCGQAWTELHGWTHIVSDIAIFGAYMAIPVLLTFFIFRRRDVPFLPIFALFIAFIMFCGTTHLVEATIFWHPWYRLSALMKAGTAVVSWLTVIALIPAIPKALALPGLATLNAELEQRVKQRTTDLERSNEALQQSNMELEQMTFVASHDLQTPLRSISGFLQILKSNAASKLSQSEIEMIDRSVEGAVLMKSLIDDLLSFSRIDNSSRALEDVPFGATIEQACEALHGTLEEANGRVTFDPLPTVRGDRMQLFQLAVNLIGNGIKYSNDPEPHVHISAKEKADRWVISFKDNGIGIAPEHQKKIFEVFGRLHTKSKYAGNGIGLAICRRVARRHHGDIWVESEDGKGAVFYVSLPNLDG